MTVTFSNNSRHDSNNTASIAQGLISPPNPSHTLPLSRKIIFRDSVLYNLIVGTFPIIIVLFYLFFVPSMGVDFTLLYPAGQAVWQGQNPYTAAPMFFNPPWALFILTPLSIFPIQIARWIWFTLGAIAYLFIFHRLKLSQWGRVALLLSPFIYFDLGIGNMDWLVMLGLVLPESIGAWLITLKPQFSVIIFILWVKQRKYIVLIPFAILGMLVIFQVWQLPNITDKPWNASIFPYGIPIGLWLGWQAYKQDDKILALAAMPFLSPYLAFQSWVFALLPLSRQRWYWMVSGLILSWVGAYLFFNFR